MNNPRYQINKPEDSRLINVWDTVVMLIVFSILAIIAWGAMQMNAPFEIGDQIEISLDPSYLPQYSVSTILRMFIAMFFSLLFTFTVAPLAAKSKQAEKFIIPFIDIMQSIPVLGMLSITVVGFIRIFPNSRLGPECAAIFAIFTSQVWNMALSLYQSLKTVPHDIKEAALMYRLSAWQRFWRVEVPHGTSPLLWNAMVSMSAGWFFVVLSEAIEVSNQKIHLPGIGSYISKAISESNFVALSYSIIAMFIVILLYDQLIFRPLLTWAEKFKTEIDDESAIHESWFFDLLAKTRFLKFIDDLFANFCEWFINAPAQKLKNTKFTISESVKQKISKTSVILWNLTLIGSLLLASTVLIIMIKDSITIQEVLHVFYLGGVTAIKVVVLIVLASLIWIPIGVLIGFNPRASLIVQPIIQFIAAFPANLFYPIAVILIVKFDLNKEIWTMPLMILGTQWYILFNVISAASTIPKEVRLAAKNFGVSGWLWWRKMVLPGIFPHYATGAMAAAGGCWNASIVAEYVEWGSDRIESLGIGQYITQYTRDGDFPRIALGIAVMCIYVMLFNRFVWQKMYEMAETRYSLN